MTTKRLSEPPSHLPNSFWIPRIPAVFSNYLLVLESIHKNFGDQVWTKLPKKTLWVFHPNQVKELLGQSNAPFFKKGDNVRTFAPLLGDGIIASEGDKWRKQRRNIAPEFHAERVREFVPILVEITELHFRKLRARKQVGLHSTLCEWGLETASQLFFGSTLPFKADDINQIFNRGAKALFIQGMLRLRGRAANLVPYASEMKASLKLINTWVYELIHNRRKQLESGCPFVNAIGPKAKNKDILSRILENSDDQEIRDQCINILMAGHDTTALTLFWTLHLLKQNPEKLEILKRELDQVFGNGLDADKVEALHYTEQVILEAMRLYPVITSMSRQAIERVKIGGTEILPGEIVQVIPWVTHRHPEIWEDGNTFLPERFELSKREQIPEGAFFPFGLGPRACVAQLLATTQMKIFLAYFVHQFDFEFEDKKFPVARPVLTLRPAQDSPVNLVQRTEVC